MIALMLTVAAAFETGSNDHLELKWVRDSEEYQAITAQTYRAALTSVMEQRRRARRQGPWTVVLDIDETVLDNSTYWLELAAYDQAFTWEGWDAWCEREVAAPIAGAPAFVDAVRDAGGRVAFVSNRHERTRASTVANLSALGLFTLEDRLCLLTDDETYSKPERRRQIRDGASPCGWEGEPTQVLAYLGDTMADLPEDGEEGLRADLLGSRAFVLPNPMYGKWEHGVTRPDLLVPGPE